MKIVLSAGLFLTVLLLLTDGYLAVFSLLSLFHGPKKSPPCEMNKRYAVLICARNEEAVIARLLDSIHAQTYPQALLQCFVMADNCTDHTADIARAHGAVVYIRKDQRALGKGYALDALLSEVGRAYPDSFDAFFIVDADSVLAADFVERMNEAFQEGHEIVCGYHHSTNMESSLFTRGQAVMFLVQNRLFNYPRAILGLGAFICGTGILIGASVIREEGGWRYHMLTEDIEFTAVQLLKGRRAYYCHEAVLYVERPLGFRDSRNQLTRWIWGFLQVLSVHGASLVRRAIRQKDFSCYDLMMCYLPMAVWVTGMLGFSVIGGIVLLVESRNLAAAFLPFLLTVGFVYAIMLVIGVTSIVLEREQLRASKRSRILSAAAYPVYMFILLGMAWISPFRSCQWKEIPRVCQTERLRPAAPDDGKQGQEKPTALPGCCDSGHDCDKPSNTP